VHVIIFCTFFFQLLLQVFCKSGLGLLLALRFILRLRWALITATKIVVASPVPYTTFHYTQGALCIALFETVTHKSTEKLS